MQRCNSVISHIQRNPLEHFDKWACPSSTYNVQLNYIIGITFYDNFMKLCSVALEWLTLGPQLQTI